ncbi:MAG: hypothetical protein HYZ33_01465, partial [Ignavibacteriales bacterium]|nr:hypothetical protein [Ignavibacteriales bacterium]
MITAALCFSQTYSFDNPNNWTHFTTESGLPSNNIKDVVEAGDSTLWVTAPSLAWFDGFQWRTVDSSYGLPLTGVVEINETFSNNIIVTVTISGGYSKIYVGNKSGFREIKTTFESSNATALDSSTFLILSNSSLYLYDKGSVTPYLPHNDLTRGKTISLLRTTNGAVWLNLISGFYRREVSQGDSPNREQKWKLMISAGTRPISIEYLAENQNGAGIVQFEVPHEKRGVWEWTSSSLPKRNPTERTTTMIALDIGPHDEAIVVYRSGDIRWRENGLWKSLTSLEARLKDISVVKFRANGDLLFGTKQGLSLFRRSPSLWKFLSHPPPDPRNHVSEIIKAKDGSFWIASSGGVEHRSTNGTYRFFEKINNENIFGITALAEDSAGNIWIGSGSAFTGVYRFDGSSWKYVHIGSDSESVFIHKIRKDRKGHLWFLGLGKNHLEGKDPGAFEYNNGTFIRWSKTPYGIVDRVGEMAQDGLINGRVYDFVEGYDSSYWFATDGGICRWKPENPQPLDSPSPNGRRGRGMRGVGTWTHWTTSNGLQQHRITSIALDQKNQLWFASDYPPGEFDPSGIGCIDTLDHIQYFGAMDGLVGENIWDIEVDSS